MNPAKCPPRGSSDEPKESSLTIEDLLALMQRTGVDALLLLWNRITPPRYIRQLEEWIVVAKDSSQGSRRKPTSFILQSLRRVHS